MKKRAPPQVTVTVGADGQWKFDPPFKGGSYVEFRQWNHYAQIAVEEYRRRVGQQPSNVMAFPAVDVDTINWDALSPKVAAAFAHEAIDEGEAESLLTVSWDFGTQMHNGTEIAYKIGRVYFANLEEGFVGPFHSIEELFQQTEINRPNGSGFIYESDEFNALALAGVLSTEYMSAGDTVEVNDEPWVVNKHGKLIRASGT